MARFGALGGVGVASDLHLEQLQAEAEPGLEEEVQYVGRYVRVVVVEQLRGRAAARDGAVLDAAAAGDATPDVTAAVPAVDMPGSKIRWYTPVQMLVDVLRVSVLYRAGLWAVPPLSNEGDATTTQAEGSAGAVAGASFAEASRRSSSIRE